MANYAKEELTYQPKGWKTYSVLTVRQKEAGLWVDFSDDRFIALRKGHLQNNLIQTYGNHASSLRLIRNDAEEYLRGIDWQK